MHEAKPVTEGDGMQALNWADFIDSLHEFRAPTFRLARAALREASTAGQTGATNPPTLDDTRPV